jgi:purine-binding chemotaxis protein CheW
MDILVCSIEEQKIGLELDKINSVVLAVETTPVPHASDYFLGAINVHGSVAPVLNMRKLLGLPAKELEIKDHFILCTIHEKQAALWVDSVLYVKNYEEELLPADSYLPNLAGLQYLVKEKDGQIILIYNLEKLLPSDSLLLEKSRPLPC